MRRLQLFVIVASLLSAAACNEPTSAPGVVRGEVGASRALATTSTTPQVGAGGTFTCALKTDGTVVCWGNDNYGEATPPTGLASVAQISVGTSHVCALKTDGTLVCWGSNSEGQTTVPAGLTSVAQISAGAYSNCALKTDETVVCWGWNAFGQAVVPAGLGPVTQVSAGGNNSCALKMDGTAVCWGDVNVNFQDVPATVPAGLASVAQIAGGSDYICALKTDGTVVCWGDNYYGESTPPAGLTSVARVSAGGAHVCVVKTDGTVVCWGSNLAGESTVPTGLSSVAQVSSSGAHTCAVKTDGTVVCWGGWNSNYFGEATVPAGLNLIVDRTPPVVSHTISGTPSAGGWYASDVTVTFSATDPESQVTTTGCATQTVSATTAVTGVTFTCVATSAGGTTTDAVTIKLDKTIPTVSGAVTSGMLGTNGWYTSNVGITWASSAAGPSGQTPSSDCATVALTSDTPSYTFTCTITTGPGIKSAPGTVTVKRDATKPVVTYAGNAGSYTVDQTVAITCSASDDLSGVASTTCAAINGGAYSFVVGSNTYSATATDNAGNVGSATTTFTVNVTAGSLCSLVRRWVSDGGVANSLCIKLQHGDYDPFRNELAAQSGKEISAANAAILVGLVNVL